VEVDTSIVLRGLKDALAGGKLLLTDDEAKAALTQLQTDLRNKQMEKMKEAADLNKKTGADFMEANKAKEGVVTLPSGLQYKTLIEGTGPKPAPTDTVSCNYRGTLLDGTEFDSSYKRGQPAHASGIEVAAFHSIRLGLWRSWRGPALGHRPKRDPHL
jgi:FKBP-type peptidyl-prolyl cis-trans isomerase